MLATSTITAEPVTLLRRHYGMLAQANADGPSLTLTQRTYEELRAGILRGRFPSGTVLAEGHARGGAQCLEDAGASGAEPASAGGVPRPGSAPPADRVGALARAPRGDPRGSGGVGEDRRPHCLRGAEPRGHRLPSPSPDSPATRGRCSRRGRVHRPRRGVSPRNRRGCEPPDRRAHPRHAQRIRSDHATRHSPEQGSPLPK